jgi:2-dehydropantoate 2-reductase
VKSQDTDAALDVLVPLVGPETIVVSLQNGMNPPRIAARLGAERVVAAFVSFPADWQGPGHVEHGGRGNVYIGELDGRRSERLREIQRLLAHVARAHVTDNVVGYLWSKQIDCSLLFAQAVTDETMADVFGHPRYQPVLIALVGEGVGVARAAGVRLLGFDGFEPLAMRPRTDAEVAEARAVLDRFAAFQRPRVKVRSGPWRDLAIRRRPTEVDHMIGWVVAEGRKLGAGMPLNEELIRQVREIEEAKRERGLHNLNELEAHRHRLYAPGVGPRENPG